MNRSIVFSSLCFLLPLLSQAQSVVSLKIDGTINPVTSDFIHRGIEKANNEHAECLLIELNTPGGLLKSARVMVGDMLTSPVPVVVYVYPSGAQAGSAGVFITLSAHIAAMAPGTNLGAAHPVSGGQQEPDPVMNEKVTNDAAAFIRSIAEKRQRNIQWAENAVRNSVSISETEAMTAKVIDLIAKNPDDLLDKIDGEKIDLANGSSRILHTKGAHIEVMEMGFFEKMLNIISDPTIAYLLMMLGMYGLLFELYSPGAIFPGIVGVIAIVLAFYSLHMLPVNYAGLSLIIFGVILFLLEIKIASHGLLAIGGAVSLLLGSLMLIRTTSTLEVARISRAAIFTTVAVSVFFFLGILGLGLKAQQRKPVTGIEGMIGETGVSIEPLAPTGTVQIHGERWRAVAVGGDITQGEKVQVVGLENLTLHVKSIAG
ncbi:NfeD family protein [Puia dinghuensis]|uniref:Serine protease n=1 Tax=Puia dinghuensis TaxID=1792502 RepID=A0A8J2UBU0_9BACT|nr:nodulation protein NfeD [Puia dinghuensis]GGA95959.1 serine protease [Puia dinghuensis]